QELRKGRSQLIEHGHTIVLGWSDQVFTVVSELVEANQSERRSTARTTGTTPSGCRSPPTSTTPPR
ncbi:hypothetical protein DLE01_35675, partial [Streptomyces sp. FT05W]